MAVKPTKTEPKGAAGGKAPAKAPAAKAPATKAARSLSPFEEMDVLFDRLSRGLMTRMGFPALGDAGWPFGAHAPKVDMIERDKEIVVRAEVPGVGKDDLEISLTDHTVTIRGRTHKETKEEKGDYHRREISSGSFQRTLALPAEVAGDQAKATFKDGVVELVLPKTSRPGGRKVPIS